MEEIELKFQVPVAKRKSLDAAIAGQAPATRVRLQAAYFDTAKRELASAGLALRVRREGRRWVQTLKGAAADGMTRREHNVPRGASAAAPPVDPTLHAGTPVGDALLALLAGRSTDALTALYRTDIHRRTRASRTRRGTVEMALDVGRIASPGGSVDVLELEIELLRGSPHAVLDTARRWVPRFGLWLDTRSKAERGDLLARGEVMAAPRRATDVQLSARMTAEAAWQAVLRACADQVIVNASQVASGEYEAEHVHQLRVGLRRLRSALRLFEAQGAGTALGDAAALLFQRLGSARDLAVIDAEFSADLRAAWGAAGGAGDAPALPPAAPGPSPTEVLREPSTQMFMLDLLGAAQLHAPGVIGASDALPWGAPVTRRIAHWHRQVVADARRYAELDDAARHRLRKRTKRLRYAVEFVAALFEPRRVRRYLRALGDVQDRLGAVSDVAVAMDAFRAAAVDDPRAGFALGWLAARRERIVRRAARELKGFDRVRRFWKDA